MTEGMDYGEGFAELGRQMSERTGDLLEAIGALEEEISNIRRTVDAAYRILIALLGLAAGTGALGIVLD